jgi:hypothetical protein
MSDFICVTQNARNGFDQLIKTLRLAQNDIYCILRIYL